MGLLSYIPQNLMTLISNYVSNALSVIAFNSANTATGASSATLNATSGLLTYTDAIASGGLGTFTLTNSSITADSVINWGIQLSAGFAGRPSSVGVVPDNGSCSFYVHNATGSGSSGTLVIWFQVIA